MASGARILMALAGLAAVAAVVTGASARDAVQPARYPTVYFVYSMNCTFTVENDAGAAVTSLAPGEYNVDVRTPVAFGAVPLEAMGATGMTACRGLAQFQLTGPGINLNTTVYGGCLTDEDFLETFQPSSTYVAQDDNQPSVTHTVITTLASGTPTPPPPIASGSGVGTPSTDIVGSAVHPLLGTLTATLNAAGKVTLMRGRKPVSKLKAGRYRFRVTDRDPRGSFTVQAPSLGATTNLSGSRFVGRRTVTITLAPGRWMYFSGSGKIRHFVVTG